MTDAGKAVWLVITNAPDRATADTIARGLTEARLAACVNVMSPCASVYRWQGAVETAEEVPVFIKTTAERYAEVEALIRSLHPYELPEVLAVPAARGLPAYLAWVEAETARGAA
jgi:periplasmic divalent cation tolerance protein